MYRRTRPRKCMTCCVHVCTRITAHTQVQTAESGAQTMTAPQALVTEALAAGMQSRISGGNGGDVGGGNRLEVSTLMACLSAAHSVCAGSRLPCRPCVTERLWVRTGHHSPLQLVFMRKCNFNVEHTEYIHTHKHLTCCVII
jgi:hypothetical protein